jgi:YgiT-type zinc finger domain-containing protein
MNPRKTPVYICSECQTGHLKPGHITYHTWVGEHLLTIPQFAAWICDVCGRVEYDEYALELLNRLLNGRPETGRGSASQSRSHIHKP